jgi:hypothetical protein
MHISSTSLGWSCLALLLAAVPACDRTSKDAAPAAASGDAAKRGDPDKNAPPAKSAAAQPGPDGKLVLETVDVPNLGAIKLPTGYKKIDETPTGGSYTLQLEGMNYVNVAWERPPETKGLAKDWKTYASVLATNATVKANTDLEGGRVEVVAQRASDATTFVIVFGEDRYLNCYGIGVDVEELRTLCRSMPTA